MSGMYILASRSCGRWNAYGLRRRFILSFGARSVPLLYTINKLVLVVRSVILFQMIEPFFRLKNNGFV